MSTRQLGMLLAKMGFPKKKVHISATSVRGWMVYKRETDEINLAKKSGTSGQPDNLF